MCTVNWTGLRRSRAGLPHFAWPVCLLLARVAQASAGPTASASVPRNSLPTIKRSITSLLLCVLRASVVNPVR